MVCAGGNGTGVCNGDSGGPLVRDQGGIPVEVEVVSWSVKCGELNLGTATAAALTIWLRT